MEKAEKLRSKDLDQNKKQTLMGETNKMIEKFKEHKAYKKEVGPIEIEIKNLITQFNKVKQTVAQNITPAPAPSQKTA